MIDAYSEGQNAHLIGLPLDANPYGLTEQETLHFAWRDGWQAAQDRVEGQHA